MRETSVDKVSRALAAARMRGDTELVTAVRHDINYTMLSLDDIIVKHQLESFEASASEGTEQEIQ